MKRRLAALFAMALAIALACPAFALADEPTVTTLTGPGPVVSEDTLKIAGNTFSAKSVLSDLTTESDLYWVGQTLMGNDLTTGGDIVAAGQTLTFSGANVGGSLRAAAQTIAIDEVKAARNVTVAAQDITFGKDASAAALMSASATLEMAGTVECLQATAGQVTISGHVTGDAYVDADTVTIADSAVIDGALIVTASAEPTIPAGAKVGSVEFTKMETSTPDENTTPLSNNIINITPMFYVVGAFVCAFLFCLAALLLTWLLPKAVDGAAASVRLTTAKHLVSGAIILVFGWLFVLLAVIAVFPVGLALIFFLLAISVICVPFAGASLMRLAVPGMNRYGAAAIGGAVAGLLSVIPVVGAVLAAACFAYMTGYCFVALRDGMTAPSVHGNHMHQFDAPVDAPQPPTGV